MAYDSLRRRNIWNHVQFNLYTNKGKYCIVWAMRKQVCPRGYSSSSLLNCSNPLLLCDSLTLLTQLLIAFWVWVHRCTKVIANNAAGSWFFFQLLITGAGVSACRGYCAWNELSGVTKKYEVNPLPAVSATLLCACKVRTNKGLLSYCVQTTLAVNVVIKGEVG